MATGVVIRLKNLPLAAGTIDIRHFFKGLRIPDGGVHIIGGEDGTAFILFSTDEDARRAMLQDKQVLHSAEIKLMLSSHTEMKTVIEQSQRICEQLRGQRPPEPPITNLSSQSTANNYKESNKQYQAKPPPSPKITPESLDVNDVYIEIKGMPYSVNKADITYFFSSLSVSAIKFMLDEKGRKNGSGYIKFATPLEKLHGLKRDRKYIGSRFVKLTSVTERQWLLANSQPNETVRLVSDNSINRKRQQSIVSPDDSTPKRSRELSPLKTDNCVEVRGLPSSAAFKDVGDLFTRLKFVDGGLFVEMEGNKCKGLAYVEFISYGDYKQALEKDGDMVNGKQVRVVSISKQNMLDQISRHKKLCKFKREELEKEKKLKEKRLRDHEYQKKKDHHSRKQKEMGEWLQRQHQKEENERKKVEANERQAMQQAEEKRQLQLLLSDKNLLESLKASTDFRLSEELKQKILELTETPTVVGEPKVEPVEEPLLGAGEMDIEVDSPSRNEPSGETDSKVQQNITVPSSSVGFPVLGNSGSIITPQVPLGFNPAVPLLSPPFPAIAGVPNIANLSFSSSIVPVLTNPSLITTQAGGTLNPLPPLPPATILPPAVPPVPIQPVNMLPSLPNTVTSEKAPPLPMSQNDSVEPAPYIRLANTPFNVTEDQLRNFFNGMTIPEGCIQFINRGKRRSGHIFIKFATNEDATKASLKNDHKLLGRNVLVKQASFESLASMYKYVTKGGKYTPTFADPPAIKRDVGKVENAVNLDNVFTKRILDDRMTCVCIGNVPAAVGEDDIRKLLNGIKYIPNRIVVLRNAEGMCKGDVYVELETPEDCVKAANLHGNAKISDQIIRVLPLTTDAMEKDLTCRRAKPAPVSSAPLQPPSNGHISIPGATVPSLNSFNQFPRSDLKPPQCGPSKPPFDVRMEAPGKNLPSFPRPPFDPVFPPPPLDSVLSRPSIDPLALSLEPPPPLPQQPLSEPPLPFGPADLLMPPLTDDLLRLPLPPVFDPALGLPPVPSLPPPLPPSSLLINRPPLNLNSSPAKTIKMSNLSYSVTREDILEFFARFDPLPDSIRLMYNNNGKLTGDGIITFPNFQAAQAAVEQLNRKTFLSRKIRLSMQ